MNVREQPAIGGIAAARGRIRTRARWHVIVLTALFAFLWQSLVTQAHVHFAPITYSAVVAGKAGSTAHIAPPRSSPDLPANCPLCREIAHSGGYLPPTPILLGAPEPATIRLVAPPLRALAFGERSHAWQSRAPPQQLQA
jgi:hypothetical protein